MGKKFKTQERRRNLCEILRLETYDASKILFLEQLMKLGTLGTLKRDPEESEAQN